MKTIGLIGGLSWESTATYYKLMNRIAGDCLGGIHSARLLMWSFDFAEVAELQAAGDWDRLHDLMIQAGRTLQDGGADALIICTNTMHKCVDLMEEALYVPILHICDVTAKAIWQQESRAPILLGTRYTMEQAFYRDRLARNGVAVVVPEKDDRDEIHRIIYDELCKGKILPESKQAYLEIINRLAGKGADGVILGCTEIGLLIGQEDLELPVFDTTILHTTAAMDWALED
ncbi:aspartate/glutamate racemase family protein [Emcibacter sp.]|uniref:aspartate/glutamate racemase family protein n=1 Tax=Emcibacter sp. TaxID=1979954 RepID=UPI002AA71F13|nr:aspartate/glutamate racemase family protein [Emcibacter sp.]